MTIEELMEALDCTEEEARDVIACDKAIDRGERVRFDLDKTQEKQILKDAHKGTEKATGKAKTARKAPEKPEKVLIISEIATFLSKNLAFSAGNVEIVNKNQKISFKIGENSYSITLTQHRKS